MNYLERVVVGGVILVALLIAIAGCIVANANQGYIRELQEQVIDLKEELETEKRVREKGVDECWEVVDNIEDHCNYCDVCGKPSIWMQGWLQRQKAKKKWDPPVEFPDPLEPLPAYP